MPYHRVMVGSRKIDRTINVHETGSVMRSNVSWIDHTEFQSEQLSTLIIIYLLVSFESIVNNHEPGSRVFFTRSIYHITYSLLENYGHEKIIATLLNMPTIEYYDP